MNGQFTNIGLHDITFDTNKVSKVCFFEDFIVFFANVILTNVNLNLSFAVLDMSKTCFTLTAFGHNPTCNGCSLCQFFQLFFFFIFILCFQFSRVSRTVKTFTEWVNTLFSQCRHFFTTDNLLVI